MRRTFSNLDEPYKSNNQVLLSSIKGLNYTTDSKLGSMDAKYTTHKLKLEKSGHLELSSNKYLNIDQESKYEDVKSLTDNESVQTSYWLNSKSKLLPNSHFTTLMRSKNTTNRFVVEEDKTLSAKLHEAKNEISRLKLELQKERHLRDMQICKVCENKNASDNGDEQIGNYINKQLDKIKKEYEDDLLFQKFEQEAIYQASNEVKGNETNYTSSASSNKISANANNVSISMNVSSNCSSTKQCQGLH